MSVRDPWWRKDGISHDSFAVPALEADLLNQMFGGEDPGKLTSLAQESSYERAIDSQASGPAAGRWHNRFCFAETPRWSLLCLDEEPPQQVGC